MMQGIFNSSAIPVLEQMVQFTQARHEVLAGNVANLGTPGYVARDLSVADFQTRLQDAIEARHQPVPATSSGGMSGGTLGDMSTLGFGMSGIASGITSTSAAGTSNAVTADRSDPVAGAAKDPRSILFHDESDNAAELQVTEMVKNQLQHNTALAILADQYRLLQSVIAERV
jgi:flagellar basal-body rod protein FlgB